MHNGTAANHYRYRFATESRDAISQEFLEYYAKRYPGLEAAAEVVVSDRRAVNRLETLESYFIPKAALSENGLGQDFPFGSGNFASNLPTVLTAKRTLPFLFGGRSKLRHKVVVTNAPISFRPPDPVQIGNGAFRFTFSGTAPKDGELLLIYRFDRTGQPVPPDALAGLIRDGDRVGMTTLYSWNLLPDGKEGQKP